MFNCNDCKNKVICAQKIQTEELIKETKELKEKYKNFYGRITISCDYFVSDSQTSQLNSWIKSK